ncbi:MAG TPA: DUF2997 domain-containing protein [Anaeromyxobacteraceae bacterium]|nr:DUF2997 domain-containing protein [Anaeromyxobacteraceae bacterium]
MADRIEIEISISPEGEVRLVTRGLKGESCLAETESLEKALGQVRARQKTGEFYEKAAAGTVRVKRGR